MGWLSSFVRDPVGTIGETGQKVVNEVGNAGKAIDQTVRDVIPGGWTTAALLAGAYYYAPEIGAWVNSAGTPVATASEVAAADTAAGVVGSTGTGAAVGSTGTGLQATGGLGLTGGNTANLAAMGGAQGLTTTGATGSLLGATGGALAAGGLGAGLGLSSAAMGAGTGLAAGAGLGGLTASQLAQAGLVQGGLGLLGGLVGGNTVADAQRQTAAQQAALAEKTLSMGKFNPIGTTTTFGTSNFQIDPTTGQITSAGYQLSPQLQAYQNQIMGGGQQSLTDAANLQALGRGYIAQSPEAAAQQWMQSQQALLAPSRDMESARLANQLQQTGRTGVSVAQGGMLGMANPEQQALQNRRLMEDLQLASQAQQQGRAQTTFGQGLLTGAYDPFNAGLKTATTVEGLAQQPFGLSTDLAQQSSIAGARQASNYANAMGSSIASQQAANSFNPWATALQGAASNPATSQGLVKLWS
jgi:hypothetical protein